jgi:hypothetical protein
MPGSDVDHGAIKCLVPGNESRFQKYINESRVSSAVNVMLHLFLVRENSSMEGVGGMRSAPASFLEEGGCSSLSLKTNYLDFLDSISN